jgi:3-phosphoshikimate 1-carboxyvinyltransferase
MSAAPDAPPAGLKTLTLRPVAGPLRGRAAPPGSKSITNRALLLAALSEGESRLSGALTSDDTVHMSVALRSMGVEIDHVDPTTFVVRGTGRLKAPPAPLFLGNAGTATRFLTAAACLADGTVVIDGDAHMRRRPIGPLIDALRAIGVDVEAPTGCPPVTVRATGGFAAARIEIDGSLSSQYVSAMLMLAARGTGAVEVVLKGGDIGARGYVDLTVALMRHFGARVEAVSPSAWCVAATGYRAADLAIEPDASAASYLWAAERLTGGAIDLGVPASAFTQPDARAYDLIRAFPDLPAVIDGSQMQDAVPTLAVMAMFNRTPVRFTGIANLRVKECDRVSALATELSRIVPGLAREDGDDLVVAGSLDYRGQHRPTQVRTYADHRIAMSFALVGLLLEGIEILDPDCVNKTFPGYWDALRGLGVAMVPGTVR